MPEPPSRPDRWTRVEELFHAALEQSPERRAGFLSLTCDADAELRREVESLLAQHGAGDSLFERPALAHAGQPAGSVADASPVWSACMMGGTYPIGGSVGAGERGEVFGAMDPRLGREVAMKTAHEEFSGRFQREARAIAALNHANICTLYDVGPNYLVMELIEGTPLKGPLSLDQALQYAAQICDALDAAHRKGITHRDLKPANILVTKQGIKLLDFGLARMAPGENDPTLTRPGVVMGTPAYMAPEQREGKPGDARSDIYAFGCVLCELLTGKRAAQERTPVEPAALEGVLGTCLEKDPEDRWQSARDLKRALGWVVGQGPPGRVGHARPLPWVVAGVAVLIAAAALWVAWRPTRPVDRPLMRFSTDLGPEAVAGFSVTAAISPDGARLAFVARRPC